MRARQLNDQLEMANWRRAENTPGGGGVIEMSANLSPNFDMSFTGTANITGPTSTAGAASIASTPAEHISIALIGPDAEKRDAVAGALARWPGAQLRQFPSYPPALDDVAGLLRLGFDVILIEADSDPDYAVQIIEAIGSRDSATVMAYAWSAKQELTERFKRAGAKEYLEAPFEFSVPSALERAADARNAKNNPARSWEAKLLVFLGAKGGAGTTTLACSYAMALAQESRQRTLLIDLGLPLGDAALNLGLTSEYSTEDVFKDPERMDPSLLEALVVKHASGVEVLAAPSEVSETIQSNDAIDKLMKIARKVYTNVIVDVGSRVDLMNTTLFSEAYRIYLVSQAGIPDLRNADRLMSSYFSDEGKRLEIVINRFDTGARRVSEEQMASALGRPVRWKVPSDHDAVHKLHNAQASVSETDSSFSRSMLEMAGSITLHPVRASKAPATASAPAMVEEASATPEQEPKASENEGSKDTNKAEIAPMGPDGLPNVHWPTPEGICYGTPLSDVQLNATAAIPGTFVYTPGPGYVLPVGTHTLWVTFNPANGQMVQSAVSISVAKATPSINWPMPKPISCDTPLSEAELNATASVPGKYKYSPEIGKVLNAGEYLLTVVFTPNEDRSYCPTEATVAITIEKLKPAIEWPTPEKMRCGSKLSPKELNAKASAAGTFVYSPQAGEVLEPGEHVLTAHFMPADSSRYTTVQSNITVTVMKAPPRITWATPEPVVYGTVLGPGQLNATASEEGTFEYSPGVGTMLAVGEHTPLVTFRPFNNEDHPSVQTAVTLSVVMAQSTISWNQPSAISAGKALSADELNATASVPGTFLYKPTLGEILPVGEHTLTVTFTPTDTMNYEPVKAAVALTVSELAKVEINWLAPNAIPYGTPLSDAQLNATASVLGTFVYGPSEGNVLPPGKHTLLAVFTPHDPYTHAVTNATVTLKVDPVFDVASLLTVHTQGPLGSDVDDQAIPEINEQEIVRMSGAPVELEVAVKKQVEVVVGRVAAIENGSAPATSRETRTYKGVNYEKGEDGQWHRLQS
jgi:MinD-like ATPase involved in chromosome partitioning or flagellar assembly